MTTPATYHTPAGWCERCTMRDDKAEHQIRIIGQYPLAVSCTCRRIIHGGQPEYEPIAPIPVGNGAVDVAWAAWHLYHADQAQESQ